MVGETLPSIKIYLGYVVCISVPFFICPIFAGGSLYTRTFGCVRLFGVLSRAVSFGAVGTTLGIIVGFENTGDIPTVLGMGLLYGGMAAINGAMLIGYPLQIIDSIFQPIADDKVTLSCLGPELDPTSGLLGVKSISIAKLNFEF